MSCNPSGESCIGPDAAPKHEPCIGPGAAPKHRATRRRKKRKVEQQLHRMAAQKIKSKAKPERILPTVAQKHGHLSLQNAKALLKKQVACAIAQLEDRPHHHENFRGIPALKVLTVAPAWALALMYDNKDCENRTKPWPKQFNGTCAWMAIVASSNNNLATEQTASAMAGREKPTVEKAYKCKNKCLGMALIGPPTEDSQSSKWRLSGMKFQWTVHRTFRFTQSIPGFNCRPGPPMPFELQPEASYKLKAIQSCIRSTRKGFFVM